nr:hypothetical protein [Tanacetum cinerariifolium]
MVLVDHMGWKLRRKQWTGTTDQLIEDLEAAYGNDLKAFCSKLIFYKCRMYVSGRVDIFDMVDIDLFIVVALNMKVLKLGYTGKSEFMFYNYLNPVTSLYEGLYALACEKDVRCMVTIVWSFKLIEVYIEYGVTVLDSYLRAPRFRATLEEITDDLGGIVIDDVMRQLSFDEKKLDGEAGFTDVVGSGVDTSWLSHDESFGVDDLDLNLKEPRLALKNLLWQRLALKNSLWQRLALRRKEKRSLINTSFLNEYECSSLALD